MLLLVRDLAWIHMTFDLGLKYIFCQVLPVRLTVPHSVYSEDEDMKAGGGGRLAVGG